MAISASYLVSGGAGFIGSNFVRHVLAHTHARVTVLDKLTYAGDLGTLARPPAERLEVVRGDIADQVVVEELAAKVAAEDGVLVHVAGDRARWQLRRLG